jgi:hypothetical protein
VGNIDWPLRRHSLSRRIMAACTDRSVGMPHAFPTRVPDTALSAIAYKSRVFCAVLTDWTGEVGGGNFQDYSTG